MASELHESPEIGIELKELTRSNSYDYVLNSSMESVCMLDAPSQLEEESPYWYPSHEERELMEELRKLKLKIFNRMELKYVTLLFYTVNY